MSANSKAMRQWRIKNPDYMHDYYLANKDSLIDYGRKWRAENPDKMRGLNKRKYQRNREEIIASIKNWRESNPEKAIVYSLFSNAMRDGKLQRPNLCSKCGGIVHIDSHHPDYSKPFETVPLCRTCHKRLHAEVLI